MTSLTGHYENGVVSGTERGRSKNNVNARSKEKSLVRGNMMKKKEEKKIVLPTCSYKIKLS